MLFNWVFTHGRESNMLRSFNSDPCLLGIFDVRCKYDEEFSNLLQSTTFSRRSWCANIKHGKACNGRVNLKRAQGISFEAQEDALFIYFVLLACSRGKGFDSKTIVIGYACFLTYITSPRRRKNEWDCTTSDTHQNKILHE